MDKTTAVSTLSAVVALASAVLTVVLGSFFEARRRRATQRQETRDVLARYGDPLLEAASALQVRVTELLKRDGSGTREDRAYDHVRSSTMYRLGAYLGQVEIIKRDVVYLNTGSWKRSTELLKRLRDVRGALNAGIPEDPLFRLYGDEQRALGEVMVDPEPHPDGRHRCLGFAAFSRKMTEDPEFARWFAPLLADYDRAAADLELGTIRGPQLEAALAALVNHLDPANQRLLFERTPAQ